MAVDLWVAFAVWLIVARIDEYTQFEQNAWLKLGCLAEKYVDHVVLMWGLVWIERMAVVE